MTEPKTDFIICEVGNSLTSIEPVLTSTDEDVAIEAMEEFKKDTTKKYLIVERKRKEKDDQPQL